MLPAIIHHKFAPFALTVVICLTIRIRRIDATFPTWLNLTAHIPAIVLPALIVTRADNLIVVFVTQNQRILNLANIRGRNTKPHVNSSKLLEYIEECTKAPC
jgi:hypothetical protein